MLIPLQTLPKLRINLRKKISLLVLFALGTVAVAAAIVRCTLFVKDATLIKVLTWSGIEQVVCAIVANAPALRPLFFRGRHFESKESHDVPSSGRSHDVYEMAPKDTGFVSVVSSGAVRDEDERVVTPPAMAVLRTVEFTRHSTQRGRSEEDLTIS